MEKTKVKAKRWYDVRCWMGKSGNAIHMACNILNLYNEQNTTSKT